MPEEPREPEEPDLPPREDWTVVVVPRAVAVDDVDALLDEVADRVDGAVAEDERAVAQVVDARYVASERHLVDAFAKALRAHRRGEGVAEALAMETLLYAAGTRQIDEATAIGPGSDTDVVAVVAASTGTGDGDAVRQALEAVGEAPEGFPCSDETAMMDVYDVAERELAAVSGEGAEARARALERLVRERVALLDVEK